MGEAMQLMKLHILFRLRKDPSPFRAKSTGAAPLAPRRASPRKAEKHTRHPFTHNYFTTSRFIVNRIGFHRITFVQSIHFEYQPPKEKDTFLYKNTDCFLQKLFRSDFPFSRPFHARYI